MEYSQSAADLAHLESQAEETMGLMSEKIGSLRDLSVAMGHEINKSRDNLLYLSQDMGLTQERIRRNVNRMKLFAERSGVPWRVWLIFLGLVAWFFMYSWLF